jgi:TrbL/VirB6 plasmid conjugal transfer protein
MSFLGDFETAVTGFLGTVAAAGSGIVGIFQGAFIVGFMIWIMVIGYDVAYGRSEEPLGYMMKKIFRMFFIGTFALYAWPQIANLLLGVKDGLGYKHFKSLFAAAADVLPRAISVRLNCITVYLRDCIGKTAFQAQKYRCKCAPTHSNSHCKQPPLQPECLG